MQSVILREEYDEASRKEQLDTMKEQLYTIPVNDAFIATVPSVVAPFNVLPSVSNDAPVEPTSAIVNVRSL